MDEWIPKVDLYSITSGDPPAKKKKGRPPRKRAATEAPAESQGTTTTLTSRGRSVAPDIVNGSTTVEEIQMSEEEYDLLQHKLPDKNFEKVYFGAWEVKVW